METIEGETYKVSYDVGHATLKISGALRLNGAADYAPIANTFAAMLKSGPAQIEVDLSELQFLNSSGLTMLSKFVIDVRNAKSVQLTLLGSNAIPWQEKSLKNMNKLFPGLALKWNG